MREIKPTLTPELSNHVGRGSVDAAPAFRISRYRSLVEQVARLSYLNKDHLLFFRGQRHDYTSKAGSSTFYPSIYRGDYVPSSELRFRFDTLEEAARQLTHLFTDRRVDGHQELKRKKYIQWSLLQHYGVCSTPLLDLTHSLRVACSFAQLGVTKSECYVFVFGLPYITNRITINSEHDLALIRLLSICPPNALRPYFQEGYLAATEDITTDFDNKTELDFRNRLIAKFQIPSGHSFWGAGFSSIPDSVLNPKNDSVEALCREIQTRVTEEILPGELGQFMKLWTDLEQEIISIARARDPQAHTLLRAINALSQAEVIDPASARTLNEIRAFRNVLAHEPRKVKPTELADYINRVSLFRDNVLTPHRK